MIVKELIEKLQKCDQDRLVVLACDEEGNSYSLCSDRVTMGAYADREVGIDVLNDQDRKLGYTEEDIVVGERCIVLSPIH